MSGKSVNVLHSSIQGHSCWATETRKWNPCSAPDMAESHGQSHLTSLSVDASAGDMETKECEGQRWTCTSSWVWGWNTGGLWARLPSPLCLLAFVQKQRSTLRLEVLKLKPHFSMCDHKNPVLFSRNSLSYVTQVCRVEMQKHGTCLVVQWLSLCPSNAGGTGQPLVRD